MTENAFKQGITKMDGNSIKEFKEIYELGILLKPDPSTFAVLLDYFDKNHHHGRGYTYPSMTALMFVDIYEGFGGKRYCRDCRYIAQKAGEVLKTKGFETLLEP